MKQLPLANRSLYLSLGAIGSFFLAVVSFVLFFRTTMTLFLLLLLVFFVASLVLSIVSIWSAAKGKRVIFADPSKFSGKNECNAAKVIGIVSIVLNIVFVFVAILSVWVISHAFH